MTKPKTSKRFESLKPGGEFQAILREAIQTVEDELNLEDAGWINFSQTDGVITDQARQANLKLSRLYNATDPLGRQSIRLWTDYTFGSGMTWSCDEESTNKVLESFWDAGANKNVLSVRGQRKSSDKLLEDGEIFFAIILGSSKDSAKIRTISPLEITEIITNPEDIDDVRYYKREWADRDSKTHTTIYRDYTNVKDGGVDGVNKNDDALIYHLAYNSTSQRGNPLLLPALDWIKQYRHFLASRVAIVLALARFAWKTKVKGGQTAVNAIKAKTHEQEIAAGSHLLENLGSDTTPIKTESGASSAYQDGRMLRLQICAAVGIPEQYFGDISTGNLATAKTVELPMLKMFQSYQAIWADTFKDINNIILEHAGIAEDKRYVDMDFPPITPMDVLEAADAMVKIAGVMPSVMDTPDVQQLALLILGVNDPAEVLDAMSQESKSNPEVTLLRAVRTFKESIEIYSDWMSVYHKSSSNITAIEQTIRDYEGAVDN